VVLISWLEIERRNVEHLGSLAGTTVPAMVRQVGAAAVFGGPALAGGFVVVAHAARSSTAAQPKGRKSVTIVIS
jgi:hypothetical protein